MRDRLRALAWLGLFAVAAGAIGADDLDELRGWLERRRLHTRKMDERVARLEAELALLATVRAVSDTELPAKITELGDTFAQIVRDAAGGSDVR